jgi:Pyruvate/2-oxoacid:ferredoxin oxidoreductase gamma subunit
LSEITNIIITGVGGQGILLSSEIISEASVHAGYDVKRSEVHEVEASTVIFALAKRYTHLSS